MNARRGESSRYWQLVWLAGVSSFRRRYSDSILGYVWMLLQPVLLFAVLYFVFTRVIRFGGEVEAYPIMLLLNIMLFRYFADATGRSVRSLVSRSGLIRKLRFPRSMLPVSVVLSATLTLAGSLIVWLVWTLAYGIEPMATWLLLPVVLAALVGLTTATSLLLSGLFVPVRDVSQAWLPISRMLFYAAPIIFPIELVPAGLLRTIAALNPLTPIFVQARVWLIDPTAPNWLDAAGSPAAAALPFIVAAAIVAAAYVVFNRYSVRVAEVA
jgi:ABC-2 type transport system permease protein